MLHCHNIKNTSYHGHKECIYMCLKSMRDVAKARGRKVKGLMLHVSITYITTSEYSNIIGYLQTLCVGLFSILETKMNNFEWQLLFKKHNQVSSNQSPCIII